MRRRAAKTQNIAAVSCSVRFNQAAAQRADSDSVNIGAACRNHRVLNSATRDSQPDRHKPCSFGEVSSALQWMFSCRRARADGFRNQANTKWRWLHFRARSPCAQSAPRVVARRAGKLRRRLYIGDIAKVPQPASRSLARPLGSPAGDREVQYETKCNKATQSTCAVLGFWYD